jgi:ATP-dependent Zn protease
VAQWGLSSSKRPIWEQIVAADHALKKEARQMLDAAYARGLDLMRERKLQVRAVASALLKRRALAHDDIAALLARSGAGVKKTAAPRRSRKRA